MLSFSSILSGLLLIPFFGWGVYTLRQRYRYRREFSPTVEYVTLAGVGLFCAIEVLLLKSSFVNAPILLVFALLGLAASGAALYGAMIASVLAQALVDFVVPSSSNDSIEPRFGPAEALERQGDYEGALREYLVIARIFPKNTLAATRIADNLDKLGRPGEAAPWFERALGETVSSRQALALVNRVCEIYQRQLLQPYEAARVLQGFLRKYPEAEYGDSIRRRIERIEGETYTVTPEKSSSD